MGCGIDAPSKTADHGEARTRQLCGKAFSLADAIDGTAARPNDGDCQRISGKQSPVRVQNLWTIADFVEARRVLA
jgi:hypothetical protein